jgi:hypothetical protein
MLWRTGFDLVVDGFLTGSGEYRPASKKQEKTSRTSSHRLAIESRNG